MDISDQGNIFSRETNKSLVTSATRNHALLYQMLLKKTVNTKNNNNKRNNKITT